MMYKLRLPLEIAARDDLSVAVAWHGEPGSAGSVTCFADPRLAALGWRVVGPSAVIGGFIS
jgi:hypothetical protein